MNIEDLRSYCLSFLNVTEELPFGPDNLVFKVHGKMFLLLDLESRPLQFNVKCDPEYAQQLRETYPDCVFPAYHMNKRHWNTIVSGPELSYAMTRSFIEDSYRLVVSGLPKKYREA